MRSWYVRWILNAGLGSVFLFALPLFPLAVTDSSLVSGGEIVKRFDRAFSSVEEVRACVTVVRAGGVKMQ